MRVSTRAYHHSLILTVVMVPIHHNVLNLDVISFRDLVPVLVVVHHLIALCIASIFTDEHRSGSYLIALAYHENVLIWYIRIRGLHRLLCPNDIWNLAKVRQPRLPCFLLKWKLEPSYTILARVWNRARLLSRRHCFAMRIFVIHDIFNNPANLALRIHERCGLSRT